MWATQNDLQRPIAGNDKSVNSRSEPVDQMPALLRFVTLFSKDIHVAVNFYRGLGLEFLQEQHGDGPLHFSHAGSSVTIEIYPVNDASADAERSASDVMLGLEAGSLEDIVAAVISNGGLVLKDIASVDLGRRVVVQDPDGRKLYVYSNAGTR